MAHAVEMNSQRRRETGNYIIRCSFSKLVYFTALHCTALVCRDVLELHPNLVDEADRGKQEETFVKQLVENSADNEQLLEYIEES